MSSLNPLTKFEEVHDSDLVVTITKIYNIKILKLVLNHIYSGAHCQFKSNKYSTTA